MLSETAEQPPEWFETDPLRVALKVTVLAQVMKNDPKFGMRILGQEVGTKVLFKRRRRRVCIPRAEAVRTWRLGVSGCGMRGVVG